MVVGICSFELHLPQAVSLKQKRKVVKSVIEQLHQRFRLSIAETAYHDLHQRAEISLAAIVQNHQEGQRLMAAARAIVEDHTDAVLLHWDPQWIEEV